MTTDADGGTNADQAFAHVIAIFHTVGTVCFLDCSRRLATDVKRAFDMLRTSPSDFPLLFV